ncbi:MAG TPA: hypothetical protein VH309_03420 [Elusimicrobiota bacterium]|nr:hypothetical protein [Elusimicrobiota bacterium]
MRRLLAAALLALAAGCSRQASLNYKHCLSLRVRMPREELFKIMGPPETTIPYVEGKSLEYLKGRTAYEWSNPAEMPSGDHVSVDEASGKVESIRCAGAEVQASVFVPPPVSTAAARSAAAAPAAAPVPSGPAPTLADAEAAYRRKDFVAAIKIAEPLASAGDANAELLTALIFLNGAAPGRETNAAATAQMWLYKSSRAQNGEAQALYASMLAANGTPSVTVAAEIKTASDLSSPAGELLEADVNLKSLYPDVVAADPDEGERLLLLSARAGDPAAQLELGGRDRTKKDLVAAYRWTLAAAKHPLVDKFSDPLHSLSSAWTPEQQADAEKLLRELRSAMKPAQIKKAEEPL